MFSKFILYFSFFLSSESLLSSLLFTVSIKACAHLLTNLQQPFSWKYLYSDNWHIPHVFGEQLWLWHILFSYGFCHWLPNLQHPCWWCLHNNSLPSYNLNLRKKVNFSEIWASNFLWLSSSVHVQGCEVHLVLYRFLMHSGQITVLKDKISQGWHFPIKNYEILGFS